MSVLPSDPFADPIQAAEHGSYLEASTLAVGRSASMTLATDSLIILGSLPRATARAVYLADDSTR